MRILFFGTPEFSVPSLEVVHASGHELALVITRPDARRGRGRRKSAPPLKRAAERMGLPVYQPEEVNAPESVRRLAGTGARLAVVVAYGAILAPQVLAVSPHGFFNLHASLLPKYRGAAPIHWALIRGERETGVTVQRVVPQLDAGPILAQRRTPVRRDDTAGTLHDRLSVLGAELLADVLEAAARGEQLPERDQDESEATFAPRLAKKHGRIDWALTSEQIENWVRGLTPWPGAHTQFVGSQRSEDVMLLRVRARPGPETAAALGRIVEIEGDGAIVVRSGHGHVTIERIKPSSRQEMGALDFVHGYRVKVGDRFQ